MSLTDMFKNPKAAVVGAGLGLLVALSPVKATIHNTPKVELAQAYAGDVKPYSNLESLLPKGYPVKDVVDVDKNNVRFEKNDREYIQFVKDNEGNPIMEVEVDYIRNEPRVIEGYSVSMNFYDITFKNISSKSIEFFEVRNWVDLATNLITPSYKNELKIRKRLGSSIIEPGQNLARNNSYCFSGVNGDTYHRLYTIEYDNSNLKFDVPNRCFN